MLIRIFFYALLFVSLASCSDDIDGSFPDPLNPAQKTFNGSLFIEVEDPSGNAVKDALVKLGDTEIMTDDQGLAFMNNVKLGASSFVTVSKSGFFHGSRRFYAEENSGRQLIKIQLI